MKNKKAKKSKKVSRATRKHARKVNQKTLVREGFVIDQELQDGELQAERDYQTEQRYFGLRDVQLTWHLKRFRKLAKSAAGYLRKLNETMNALRAQHAWLGN